MMVNKFSVSHACMATLLYWMYTSDAMPLLCDAAIIDCSDEGGGIIDE